MKQKSWIDCEGNARRDFLKFGTAGLMGLSLSDVLRLEAASQGTPKAKSIIMIWLAGGPATIDMWDLKPEAPNGIRGEFKPIGTAADGIQISEHLPNLAKVMKHCAVVRSVRHTIPSHGPGTVYMHTGHKPTPALDYPSIGSLSSRLLTTPSGVPPYVTFGRDRDRAAMGGYLGPAYNPFQVEGNGRNGDYRVRGLSLPSGVSLDQLANRAELLDTFDTRFKALDQSGSITGSLDQFQQQALDMLRSAKTRTAFDLDEESDKLRDRYGRDGFGQGALAARRLIEAGVRFVSVGTGGWDTHGDNFKKLKDSKLPELDRTLSALIEDLENRGLLDETMIYCTGEFARTPKVNGKGGRDHWAKSMAVLMAGGGFKRGYAYGTTTKDGMAPDDDPCTPADLCATMFHNLGIDAEEQLETPSGRSIALFRDGRVLRNLLS
ncbi:MAG: DUF1501 domain-containing protein [Verrucomicrobiota bacterium]